LLSIYPDLGDGNLISIPGRSRIDVTKGGDPEMTTPRDTQVDSLLPNQSSWTLFEKRLDSGEAAAWEELMGRLHARDELSWELVARRFKPGLVGLINGRLRQPIMPQKAEPDDVLQSALASFVRGFDAGKYKLRGWPGVWYLLERHVGWKCNRYLERYTAEKRDYRRERSLCNHDLPDPTSIVSANCILDELVDRLINVLTLDEFRVLELCLDGFSIDEIARHLKVARTTVEIHHKTIRLLLIESDEV
jgi:ECF sigma factor